MFTVLATSGVNNDLTGVVLASTVVYTVLGIFIMVGAIAAINAMFRLDLRHELIKDNNIAYGVAIGGFAVAISIIIAATISS